MHESERPDRVVFLRRTLCAALGVGLFSALAWRSGSAAAMRSAADDQDAAAARVAGTDLELRTVIVVRHAEKDTAGDPRDPSLSAGGAERAGRLAGMLRHAGVTHLFATELKRTRETLAPLAAETAREVRIVPAADTAALVGELERLPPGSVAVVAGHSNTVPRIVELLGGTVERVARSGSSVSLDDAEYGRVFVLNLAASTDACRVRASTRELAY